MVSKFKTTILTASLLFAASPALAGPGHSAAGEPGKAAKVSQTVVVTAKETDDGMLFEPHDLAVTKGKTVRIILKNEGQVEHELYLGTPEEVRDHAEQMLKFPEMEHDEPNAVRVDPGHHGEIIWEFTKGGTYTFACLLPGHAEMGMIGQVAVTDPERGMSEAPKASETR